MDCCENIVRICRRSGCIMCGSLLVSRRECQRQRVIPFEGKRNGGLDSLKTAGKHGIPKVGTRNYLPRPTFFSFPVRGQIIHYAVQGRRALFGSLYFFLQLLKSCITDCMFYPASILLRRFPIITSNHKFMRKFFALHSTWQHISRLSSKARHVCQILQFCRPPQQVSDLHFSRWTMCEQS